MTGARMIELAVAALLLGASIFSYRRRDPASGSYGNQGAVILLVVAAIVAIHALGGLDYRPSPAEADMLQARGR